MEPSVSTTVKCLCRRGAHGSPDYTREQLLAFFAEVSLAPDAADRRMSTYSTGMRQKVGIAIALAKGAKALLLDEPTSGLDPKASNEFSQLLTRMRDAGVAVLIATPRPLRAKESGTRVGIMKRGKLVAVHGTDEFSHADRSACTWSTCTTESMDDDLAPRAQLANTSDRCAPMPARKPSATAKGSAPAGKAASPHANTPGAVVSFVVGSVW